MNYSRRWLRLALVAGFCACRADDLTVYTVPKEAPAAPETQAPSSQAPDLAWTAPYGWTKKSASGMRLASYGVPGPDGEADLSIVVLPGEAGGDLANVNRWRGQLGLPTLQEGELAGKSSTLSSRAGPLRLVDFAGGAGHEDTRLLAALFSVRGQTWFFKLSGKQATVADAKPAFLGFLKSVRRG